MSVPKGKRNVSKQEFEHSLTVISKEITEWALRDFGIKDTVRDIRISKKYLNNMDDDDAKKLTEIADKYNNKKLIICEYPEWLLDMYRNRIMSILCDLGRNIKMANSIYATTSEEFQTRRNYQNEAVGNCYHLLYEVQNMISILPINAEKSMKYVERINQEIGAIKAWRKSDNANLKKIVGNETMQRLEIEEEVRKRFSKWVNEHGGIKLDRYPKFKNDKKNTDDNNKADT